MSNYLNKKLYSRFGLTLNQKTVQDGFTRYVKNAGFKYLDPIIFPDKYLKPEELWNNQSEVLRKMCRNLFLDIDNYDGEYVHKEGNKSGFGQLFEKICFSGSFEEFLFKLQVCLDVISEGDFLKTELGNFVTSLKEYLEDYSILGILIKDYKTKPPQILPTNSKHLDEEIEDTLGILDTEHFKSVLNEFEAGLKIFSKAKTYSEFKDVIEDMHGACDSVIKVVLKDKNKSFKNAKDKEDYKKLGLNGYQKEIFRNLKEWMDIVKHGSDKDIKREEVEMIISMTASFIRFVAINKLKGSIQ